MQPESSYRNQKFMASVIILAAVTLIVFGVGTFSNDNSPDSTLTADSGQVISESIADDKVTPPAPPNVGITPTAPPPPAPATTTRYKNGTYTATGSYSTPENTESITVTVTVEDDIVTATSAVSNADLDESKEYQADFIGGYKSRVVGRALASLNLGNVSGSSLTPQGFNNAINQIRTQAQS